MYKSFDNIFPNDFVSKLRDELDTIENWEPFKRNNSSMLEFYDIDSTVYLSQARSEFTSKKFIMLIEKFAGKSGLIIDPFGVGEGVSKMSKGDLIDKHLDFNWNDRCKLNREVNILYYLSSNWDKSDGGVFQISDYDHTPKDNSMIVFTSDLPHGVSKIMSDKTRYSIRTFYYSSNATPSSDPHQSLYWNDGTKYYNPQSKMPSNTNDKN